jgi:glycosyltransferase 2 family protein
MRMPSRTILFLISAFISALTIVIILKNIDWQTIHNLSLRMQWQWIGFSFAAYFLNLFLRSMRFKTLLQSQSISNRGLLVVTSLHNMFNYILPARSGELSYLILAKDRLNVSLVEGTASLFASRVYDFLTTTFILLFVLPFAWNKLPYWIIQSSLIFSAIVIVVCAIIILLISKVDKLGSFSPIHPRIEHLYSLFKKVIVMLSEIKKKNIHYRIGLLTVGIWFCLYTNMFFICRALNYSVDYFQVILVSLVMIPLSLLPVQGFVDLGTHELAWVTVMMVSGVSYQTALDIAIGTHFLLMTVILSFGLISMITIQFLLRPKHS